MSTSAAIATTMIKLVVLVATLGPSDWSSLGGFQSVRSTRVAANLLTVFCVGAPCVRRRGRLCDRVGSFLMFEPGVVGSVGERQGRCVSGVDSVVQPGPVQRPLGASGATAPTLIRKRNVAPVGPGGR